MVVLRFKQSKKRKKKTKKKNNNNKNNKQTENATKFTSQEGPKINVLNVPFSQKFSLNLEND